MKGGDESSGADQDEAARVFEDGSHHLSQHISDHLVVSTRRETGSVYERSQKRPREYEYSVPDERKRPAVPVAAGHHGVSAASGGK